jgi:hypothetical protein
MSRPLLTLLLLSLLLTACTSPPGPRGAPVPATQVQAAGAGSPAGPVLAISGPIVDATTNQPIVAGVYVDGTRCVTTVNNSITLHLTIPQTHYIIA